MDPLRKMTIRLLLYGGLITYLLCDLLVFHGPIARKIESRDPMSPENIAKAKANGVVARVFGYEITRTQLDRAVQQRLWESGSPEPTTHNARKLLRYAALNDLIDHELLRTKCTAFARDIVVNPEETEARFQRFKKRFTDEASLITALKSQGIKDITELRNRITAQIQQEKYVELRVGKLAKITDEEARSWFDEHRDELTAPEAIEVRHIFLTALETKEEQALSILKQALDQLHDGSKSFDQLALEISQDENTKTQGGKLGWVSRKHLPDDLAEKFFKLPLQQPAVMSSRIGWHLAEVTGHRPPQPRSYEDAREEVFTALNTIKRRAAAEKFREGLRQFEGARITVFHDMME